MRYKYILCSNNC